MGVRRPGWESAANRVLFGGQVPGLALILPTEVAIRDAGPTRKQLPRTYLSDDPGIGFALRFSIS